MNLLNELISSPWFIDQQFADQYLPIVVRMFKGDTFMQQEKELQSQVVFLNNQKPFAVNINDIFHIREEISEPSVFVCKIVGPITKYDQFCGPYGMNTKSEWLRYADEHPNIFAHVLKIDSGGGSGYAARLMSETISDLKKPVIAFFDDFGASAAYWIGSNAAFIVANSSMARIGSIGTYMSIHDYTEYFKKEGLKITDVYALKSTDKNSAYRKAIAGDLSLIQNLADEFNEFFLKHVNNSRRNKIKSTGWDTGKMFFAKEAKQLGLIDEIMSFDMLLESIFIEYGPKK